MLQPRSMRMLDHIVGSFCSKYSMETRKSLPLGTSLHNNKQKNGHTSFLGNLQCRLHKVYEEHELVEICMDKPDV